MATYYVDNKARAHGTHEVHTRDCTLLPSDRQYLGEFIDCAAAVLQAKRYFQQSRGCYFCSRECHSHAPLPVWNADRP